MERPDYIDIHSHINDPRFDEDIDRVAQEMSDANTWTIVVGTDRDLSQKAADLSTKYDGVYASIGVHPVDRPSEEFDENFYGSLVERYPKIVAVGECGLDYLRIDKDDAREKQRQKDLFLMQIEFAVAHDLPLMIHTRDPADDPMRAHEDVLDILTRAKDIHGEVLRGNVHFFSGTREIMERYIAQGFTLSVTGVITFTHDYDEVVKHAPIESLMVETDSPYVAPVPYRGKRNVPQYVREVVSTVARIRGEDESVIREAMVENAFNNFRLQEDR